MQYVALPTKSISSMAAKMLTVVNVSMEKHDKTNVSKARWYTESKKELSGNVFVNSCHACLSATMVTAPYHEHPM